MNYAGEQARPANPANAIDPESLLNSLGEAATVLVDTSTLPK